MTIRDVLPLLMVAIVMLHDGGMATHGHGNVDSGTHIDAATVRHEDHHPGGGQHDDGADVVPEACGVRRLTPTLGILEDFPATSAGGELLQIAPVLATFAAVCTSLVDHPPIHAPKTLRALYEVYRI